MKLILFAAAARLAHGADFCVPAACRKLAPGADDGGFMKDLVGDLVGVGPRRRPARRVRRARLPAVLDSVPVRS